MDWRRFADTAGDLTYQLSADEIIEVEATTAKVVRLGVDIVAVDRRCFSLPRFGGTLDALCREVVHGRGFVLLRGLPVEDKTIRENAIAYCGIGSYFRTMRSQIKSDGAERPDLVRRLFAPMPFDRRGKVPEGMLPFYFIPVLTDAGGHLSVGLYPAQHQFVAAPSGGATSDRGGCRGAGSV